MEQDGWLNSCKFGIGFPLSFNQGSRHPATFIAYKVPSGMRNLPYKPVDPEFGKCTAGLSSVGGGIWVIIIEFPANVTVRKTADQIFPIRNDFEEAECFR